MTDAADQRFAPPQSYVADPATGEMVLATRGTRFLSALVDGIIGAAVVWAVYMIPPLGALLAEQEARSLWAWNPLSLLVGTAVFLLVQGWPLLTRGQTLGKMLFKLRIVRSDGSKPDAWRLLGLRYGIGLLMGLNTVIVMIYSLIDSLLIFRASRKCLHDSIADTQVIKL
jgi:uncharacterized RDD family membrane protein YckC